MYPAWISYIRKMVAERQQPSAAAKMEAMAKKQSVFKRHHRNF